MKCRYCTSTSFRRSKFKSEDFIKVLLLELPVRCMKCRQRQGAPFLMAALANSSETRPRGRRSPHDATWTESTKGTTLDEPAQEANEKSRHEV
jgi:hypothetical protein